MAPIPIVRSLVLDPDGGAARLRAEECQACGARYYDERMACARCSGKTFAAVDLPRTGTVASYTIVHRSSGDIPVPFVAAVVRLDDGTPVKANIIGCPPDPEAVQLNMPVHLETFVAAEDSAGNQAIAFGFAPGREES